MAIKVLSCMVIGLEGKIVEVEVDILQGLSAFNIVGLGDIAVQEAKERIRSAIKNSGFTYPQQKKVINLAPAHLRKHGAHFDLPMALGILTASGQIPSRITDQVLIVGELALDGSVRSIRSVLTMALFAREQGLSSIIIPAENWHEVSLVKNINILPVRSVKEVVEALRNSSNGHNKKIPQNNFIPSTKITSNSKLIEVENDFADIKGQEIAKRALTISAAGHHHCLLFGPPGVGKTMLAKAMAGILPPLEENEMLEVMQIYSCAGLFLESNYSQHEQLIKKRPFREIQPSCSLVSLIGGGSTVKPGEISLADRGVLFLDEIAEFPRTHLESLRLPLESKKILLSRHANSIEYPAHFLLLAGMNPCPCGYYGDTKKECTCNPFQIVNYQKKLSGPLLDRLDLMVEVSRPSLEHLSKTEEPSSTSSEQITHQVQKARQIQRERFKHNSMYTNSEMTSRDLKIHCRLDPESQNFLKEVSEKTLLSGRNYHQILKVSRTIADLNGHENLQVEDISEAFQYRQRFGK